MPVGPFGEIHGTTGTLDGLSEAAQHYKSKVVAPRNPKVVRGGAPKLKLKPSQYMFQMSMNTEQKLANMHTMSIPQKVALLDMADTTHQMISYVSIDEPMFQPFPSEVIFQNFEAFNTYEVPLVLRNNDKVPRLVKVTQEDSPYFNIISPHNVGHKVGPGLPTTFKIQFRPEEKKDYYHELVCVTEREKFVVPVKAIGARAILDFPDDVMFPVTPVKYPNSRTLLVRNVGNKEANFSLSTEKPFSVTPEMGTLAVNESVQVNVEFKPTSVGDHSEDVVLHLDTGEDIYIAVHGAAQDGNVRLDKNSIRIESTFISMANQRTVTVCNRSDVIAHFKWSKFATQEEEDQQKLMFSSNLDGEENTEQDRFLEECIQDPSLRDKLSILSRTYQNKRQLVQDDKLLFADDVIKIEPIEGDIWPHSSMEVNIIFKPEQAEVYNRIGFCDITGRESRLPLRIRGDGIGPKVQFSFDEMDIGNVFVHSTHTYEVVLANKGDIDAIFSILPTNSVFGPCFNFNPSEGIVMPDGHQAIQISFSSAVLGDFKEEFMVQIDGSPLMLKLSFTGSVIGPTFHFDVPKLKFGTVSFGFVNTQTCTLVNTALVPMKYSLRVPADGLTDSICCTSDDNSSSQHVVMKGSPREFSIKPSNGTLPPKSSTSVQVNLCSNTVQKYDVALVVDVDSVGDEVLSLPVSAKCIVPQVTVMTPILDYSRCFLRHPYEHQVHFQNDTDLPAKYELLPQEIDEFTPILYTSPQPKGIVPPHSQQEVPLVITPQGLEELETTAYFSIFGAPEMPLAVQVTCIGEGPVVHVTPLNLEWGQVPVLNDIPKVVHLSNESLIPAKFTAHMVRPNSVWRVDPSSGEIPPEEEIDIIVTACLDDCVRFHDKLQINFLDSPSRTIPLSAYGHGTTIITDPPMCPTVNLGPHFSKGPCRRIFILKNSGRRHQSLVWSTEGFSFSQRPKRGNLLAPLDARDMKFRDQPPPPEPAKPVFHLTPHRMELNPGESMEVELLGSMDTPQIVRERLICHAIIGRAGGKELIMKVQINCDFINPLLEFSAETVSFRVDKHPRDELTCQFKNLVVTNVSSLPLTTNMALPYPFQIQDDEDQLSESEIYLGVGQSRTVDILFDPAYKDDAHIRIAEEQLTVSYKEHPHVDTVCLRGEVYLPNLAFEKSTVNFGCILNDTEVTRYINMTNNSPMEVKYRWSFLIDDQVYTTFQKHQPEVLDEELVLQDIPEEGQMYEDGYNTQRTASPNNDEEEELMRVEVLVQGAESPRSQDIEMDIETDNVMIESKQEENKVIADNRDVADDAVVMDGTPQQTLRDDEDEEAPEKGELDAQEAPEGKEGRQSVADSRAKSCVGTPRVAVNPKLQSLLDEEEEHKKHLGVEEVFDILPLYGTLKPGDTEQVTLTFFGHADIGSQAKALCEVEGGPTYEIILKGEASLVDYRFDCLYIDYGKISYDQVAVAEICLVNSGKVGFDFTAIGMDPGMAAKPKPGVPVMTPHAGFIEPLSELTLTIKFLPGGPEKFHKNFMIQVAHFEPDLVSLFGEGVFPRISLDLPRFSDPEGHYESLVKDAKEILTSETKKAPERPMSAVSAQRGTHREDDTTFLQDSLPSELDVQMEVERLVVQEFSLQQLEQNNQPDILHLNGKEDPSISQETVSTKKKRKHKPRPRLPDYVLDFEHVVLGTVKSHVVRATNTGWFPSSFSPDRASLYQYGFHVDLHPVKNLPGAPDHETEDFLVTFDPRGANLGLGDVEAIVPINIIGGPQVCLRLIANVTMPDMEISTDILEFGEVRCGECRVVTVQLHNHKHVDCEWNSHPTEREKRKIDKHTPLHLRRKMRQDSKPKSRTFEVIPAMGSLRPGQRLNVQVKFMPTEEHFYENRVVMRLAQSSQRIVLLCRGQGQEPHLVFDRQLVEFGPILPHSAGDEQEIIVENPCNFPVEVYSLEFDKNYLEEEKILRLMKGYDEYNTILLPPRVSGEKLPTELMEYYEEQMRKLEEAERVRREAQEAAEAAELLLQQESEKTEGADTSTQPDASHTAQLKSADDSGEVDRQHSRDESKDASKPSDKTDPAEGDNTGDGTSTVGELEVTPVSKAIARHLGIDLSPEGQAARNRRGIAIILHGAPLSGKTTAAVSLAKHYDAALLSIDTVVMEAISSGSTPAGQDARRLCKEATQRFLEEQRAMAGEEGGDKKQPGLSVEALTAHTQGTGFTVGQVAAAQSVAHSIISNRKTSTVSDQRSKDKHHAGATAKTAALGSSAPGEGSSQVPSSPAPLTAPVARRLSVSASVAGEDGLLSCVLPDDVLVDILAERLKLNDCHRGVVFDGLENVFSQNHYSTCQAVLRALNNRKYIYFVCLRLDYNILKEQERTKEEEKLREEHEKEEAERRRLEEMSEDEYDALTDAQKAEVDRKRLQIKKERLRREQERLDKERKEKEMEEEELRLRQEQEKSKGRKKKPGADKEKDSKKTQAGSKVADSKSQDRVSQLKSQDGKKGHAGDSDHTVPKQSSIAERPGSHITERGESSGDDKGKKKPGKDGRRPISTEDTKVSKGGKNRDLKGEEEAQPEEPQRDPAELLLIQRFRTFEHHYKDIIDLVDHWDRSTAIVRSATPLEGTTDPSDDPHHPPSGRKGKKASTIDKHDKKAEQEKKIAAEKAKDQLSAEGADDIDQQSDQQLTDEERRERRLATGVGVPLILLDSTERQEPPLPRIMDTGKLPIVEEVLDGLGMGPKGPPIPPPAEFAVVPYPVKRHAPPGAEAGHYHFIASSPDDPNIGLDEKLMDLDGDDDKSITPDGRKEDHATPTKGKKGDKSDGKKDRGRKSSGKNRGGGRRSSMQNSPPPGANTPASEADGSTADAAMTDGKVTKLNIFRWVIPAAGKRTLRLKFLSEDLGQFDQTMNFEIMGTRRRYQLYCRGICAFPSISREPRIVFPHRKKGKTADEIVHKKYILTSETYEFGPLLVGKSREKYKEGRYPENMEQLMIQNTSPMDADISFCFVNDSKGDTYLLDPPNMMLRPGESQEVTIWAYPKMQGIYEDALICCVKENPEPVIFKLICYGVRPEIELDKKIMHFEKVLLHRKDTKTLFLRNSTLLPVAWRLNGLENLGDDFTVSQETGVIEAKSEFGLHAYFRAMKPVNTKRVIRLEISDKDNIMGLVQTENIQVQAEAYDVALDMSFPKGADGGIDFDVIRVMDEQKQSCSLKNKGRYDIKYNFVFEPTDSCPIEVCNMFSISPSPNGTLAPTERPAPVAIQFRSEREVTVKDQPILRCQIVEPSIGEQGGETIASIPIKMSVRSVFSKYTVFPVNDINFGSMNVNSKKTKTFTIENKGDRFEFKYSISKLVREVTKIEGDRRSRVPGRALDKHNKSGDGSSSGRSGAKPKRAESISDDESKDKKTLDVDKQKRGKGNRQDMGGANTQQSRLQLGMFTIFPAFGYILPNGQQLITVDCVTESAAFCQEDIAIDIMGRDPSDHPQGIPYRLIAEACVPSIQTSDYGIIFEEHNVCKNLSVWQHTHNMESGGVYGEDENKFVFNNVLVGATAKARFKIANTNKVPCDVIFNLKPVITKHGPKNTDVFEVEPARGQIPAHSHLYATVTFSPPSMQHFSATFETVVEGMSTPQSKMRNLMFELCGEGNLPRISVAKPVVRNKKGQPLLLYRRNLLGQTQTLPLVIVNDGTLLSRVDIDLTDPDNVFTIKPTNNTSAIMAGKGTQRGSRLPHTATTMIDVGEKAYFSVVFSPQAVQRSNGQIRISVVNNLYEDTVIQLVGEGYEDDITLENLRDLTRAVCPEDEDGNMAEDDIAAAKPNLLRLGDCFINESRTVNFLMKNYAKDGCIRFAWPEHPQLKFSSQTGHLHAGCSKDVSITFKTDAPITLEEHAVICKINKITFDKPSSEVADWDDRLKTVKWVDVPMTSRSPQAEQTESTTPLPPTPARPAKKKIVEIEPEPAFTEVPESSRSLELLVSVMAEYCKYECEVKTIHFKDTLMFQTRVYEVILENKGAVSLEYNWTVDSQLFDPSAARSVTFAGGESERPPTAASLVVQERPGTSASSVLTDPTHLPFSLEPEHGRILPGKKATISVRFSPLDVNDYRATAMCNIANLDADQPPLMIDLEACSCMPYCHFELEDSDYIRSARRDPELRGPGGAPPGTTLDPTTKVIEFKTVGVGIKETRNFSIINPTNEDYSFKWVNEDEMNPKVQSCFSCLKNDGMILSGKKTDVAFNFTSRGTESVESFWKFVIPERNISQPFLLVGHTSDPSIAMDRSHLNFKSILIGHEAMETVTLVNSEDQPFSFSFDESSLHSPGYSVSLQVSPMRGIIEPNSSLPVNLFFTPNSDKEVNFNLVCRIKRKTAPLMVNVKAEGYSMKCLVMCEDSQGGKVTLESRAKNQIDFGTVEVNERCIRNMYIVNSGKFHFDYTWELREKIPGRDQIVQITPDKGGVKFGDREVCQLSFCPPRSMTLSGCDLVLKISNGPSYFMQVGGRGVLPSLKFDKMSHNFGPCFVHRAGMPAPTHKFMLRNDGNKDLSVDCLFNCTDYLKHDFKAQVILPKTNVPVEFTFYPRAPIKYHERVAFEINGLSKSHIDITGQGTEMKVEVADTRQKMLKLGALRVGQTVKRQVPIINHSPAPVTFQLTVTPSLAVLQDPAVLKVSPIGDISLAAKGGTAKIDVVFSPKVRIPQFTEEVLMECAGMYQPLFVVSGSCQGIEISLDTAAIPFGAVAQRSSSSRKLLMQNTGDIGSRFKWESEKFGPDFSIQPTEGYISSGMEVPFEVTFHPQEISNDIRNERLKCNLEGGRPLRLTLTGTCTIVQPAKEILHFTTHVRAKDTRNLMIANRTNMHWELRPVIEGEYWTGPDTLVVEPQATKPYELTYRPLVMTAENKKHTGSVFFPLPDGQGMLYTVTGTADAPKPNGRITRDVPCKTPYVEVLSVHNWQKKPQLFRYRCENIRQDRQEPGTTTRGLDYIDVPANSKRDFKFHFHAYKEGQSQYKVTFTNEQTGEYQYYEVTFRAGRPGTIDTIELSTPVRQSIQKTLELENPLAHQVAFSAWCNVGEIQMPGVAVHVPPNSKYKFSFEYQPLKVGESQGRLEFNCNDLGQYVYDLSLKATPAGPEKALYYRTCLGTHQSQSAKFTNYSKQKTDYSCTIDSIDFHVDRTVTAAPASNAGTEVAVEVVYEPSRIGESRATLTVSSANGGEYTFPLFGTCIPPKPQGPFVVKTGATTSLTFRNVFPDSTSFTFQVDNPLFHVTKPGEKIRSHKDHRIVVGFDGSDSNSKAAVMGKLIVSCVKSAGGASNAQWVYYLKGVTADTK